MPNEDISGMMLDNSKKLREENVLEQLKGFKQEAAPAYKQTEDGNVVEEAQEGAFSWPEGLSLGGVAQDVAKGLFIESPLQALGGARDAVQETFEALDGLGQWLATVPLGPDWVAEKVGMTTRAESEVPEETPQLPEVEEASTTTGSMVRGVSQFLTGFIPALRGVKALSGGREALTMGGRIMQTEAAAALSSMLVFDPHEARLSNLIEEHTELGSPITKYLMASPDDTEAEGRFKNAIEGLGLGLVAEGLMKGVRAIKANRVEKGLEPGVSAASEAPNMKWEKTLGDPSKDLVIPREDVPEGKLPFQMNWAKYTRTEDIESAVRTVAKHFVDEFDEARRGTLSDDAVKDLAGRLGMTPEDILEGRFKGGAHKAEEIVAMKTILEDATQASIDLARIAKDSGDPEDLFAFRKMIDVQSGIQKYFQGAASEAGRALRALQIPTGSREKQLQLAGEALMLGGDSPESVRRLAHAVSEITDPAEINKALTRSAGKRLSDALVEVWYGALLSGPKTQAVNIASTQLMALWQIPERKLAAAFSAARGVPGVAGGEAGQLAYGMVSSFKDALRVSARAFRDDAPSDVFTKTEPRVQAAITSENFPIGKYVEGLAAKVDSDLGKALGRGIGLGIDGLGTFFRLPGRAIMAADEFYKVVGRSMEVNALALRMASREGLEGEALAARMAELKASPTPSMLEEAQAFAQSLTFTSPLGKTGKALQEWVNQIPAMKFVLPFIRTPINLVKAAGVRTPLALASSDIRRAIIAGGPEGDLALARMTMGSMVSAAMADLALGGAVTGAGPADPDLRRIWLQDHQPYSVKVGDTWYSYNRADPFGLFLGAAASYAEVFGVLPQEDNEALATSIAVAAANSIMSKTWIIGPAEALDAITDPARHGEKWVQKTMGSLLVPTASAQFRQEGDPVWREVNSLQDALRNRVPGLSSSLPARRNVWGEKLLYEGGLGPDLISPIAKYGAKNRPIDNWLWENKVGMQMPARWQNGVELSPHQYSRFVELAGNEAKDHLGMGLYDTLNALVEGTHPNSIAWQMATDGPEGGRALIVRQYTQAFRSLANARMLTEDRDYRTRVEQRAIEQGGALQQTIMEPQGGRYVP